MNNMTTVGISDMKVVKGTGTLITYALGSCIGICLYDPALKIAGMVHIMLPGAPAWDTDNPCKYADTGIAALISKMASMGSATSRMKAKIAGGARMFEIFGESSFGNIGERNIEAVRGLLKAQRIPLLGERVGASHARTLLFFAEDGIARIRSFGTEDVTF